MFPLVAKRIGLAEVVPRYPPPDETPNSAVYVPPELSVYEAEEASYKETTFANPAGDVGELVPIPRLPEESRRMRSVVLLLLRNTILLLPSVPMAQLLLLSKKAICEGLVAVL
jgi:hypothetical protein